MGTNRKAKIAADIIIILSSAILIACIYFWRQDRLWWLGLSIVLLLLMAGTAADLVVLRRKREPEQGDCYMWADNRWVQQLILLDEKDKPIKSWDLSGKTALIIGKKNLEEEVDVDLDDCEYGTFIDAQHAALNYCMDSWYIEDLGSQNGVKIRKVEDGVCYKVLNRPCKVSAGDIIYIANTRLLLT